VFFFREKLVLADGGVIMLDWVSNETSLISSEIRPTVIILPGLVGIYKLIIMFAAFVISLIQSILFLFTYNNN